MKPAKILVASAFALVLVACGGGGGSGSPTASSSSNTEISGQAAAGAPMSFAKIFIEGTPYRQDQQFYLTADIDGNFKVPVGVGFPALVKATSADGKLTYYGYIKDGLQKTVAVNPITTTLIGLADEAAVNAGAKYSLSILSPYSNSILSTARDQTAQIFSGVLGYTGIGLNTDFLSTSFSTDHTGLDLILDYITAYIPNIRGGGVIVKNKLDGKSYTEHPNSIQPITFNTPYGGLSSALPACTTLVRGLGSKITNDTSVYHTNFLDSGFGKTGYMSKMRNFVQTTTVDFVSPLFLGMDTNNNYVFSASVVNKSTNEFLSGITLYANVDSNGNCKLIGNQHPFDISIQPAIKHHTRFDAYPNSNTTQTPVAGLEIQVGAWETGTNSYNGVSIAKAKIQVCDAANTCTTIANLTSPGSTGVFGIDDPTYEFLNMIPNPSIPLVNGNPNPIKVIFYDSSNQQIGQPIYTKVLGELFSAQEVASLTMPEVTNAQSLLTATNANPVVNYNSGTSVVSSIKLYSGSNNQERLIIDSGTGSKAFVDFTLSTTNSYRAIYLSGYIPGRPGLVELKYFYAPNQFYR